MILKKKVITTAPVIITKEATKKTSNTTKTQVLDTKSKGVTIEDVSHRTHEGDSMRGLFYITQGKYRKNGDTFINTYTGDVSYIGGYDPNREDTDKWFMLRDYETHHCIACGSDYEKVLGGVYTAIKRYKGSAKRYFKHVCGVTSDDLYETRYLGRRPLTHDERIKKAEGRCPRVSLADKGLYDCLYQEYGYFFSGDIEKMEDKAYDDLERIGSKNRLVTKAKRKLMLH